MTSLVVFALRYSTVTVSYVLVNESRTRSVKFQLDPEIAKTAALAGRAAENVDVHNRPRKAARFVDCVGDILRSKPPMLTSFRWYDRELGLHLRERLWRGLAEENPVLKEVVLESPLQIIPCLMTASHSFGMPHLQTLKLHHVQFRCGAFEVFCNALRTSRLVHLALGCECVLGESLSSLWSALENNKTVTSLELEAPRFSAEGMLAEPDADPMSVLGADQLEAMMSNNTTLQQIVLIAAFQGNDQLFSRAIQAFSNGLVSNHTFKAFRSMSRPFAVRDIEALFAGLSRNRSVECLAIEVTSIAGSAALMAGLDQMANTLIESARVSGDGLPPPRLALKDLHIAMQSMPNNSRAASDFVDCLARNGSVLRLEKLVLDEKRPITTSLPESLSTIVRFSHTLQHVHLLGFRLDDNENFARLLQALSENLSVTHFRVDGSNRRGNVGVNRGPLQERINWHCSRNMVCKRVLNDENRIKLMPYLFSKLLRPQVPSSEETTAPSDEIISLDSAYGLLQNLPAVGLG